MQNSLVNVITFNLIKGLSEILIKFKLTQRNPITDTFQETVKKERKDSRNTVLASFVII